MTGDLEQELTEGSDLRAGVRDEANRVVLSMTLVRYARLEADGTIDDEGQRFLDNARAVQTQLEHAEESLDPVREGSCAQLYTFDFAAFGGDGSAAVVVGDADTAEHVAFVVPGMKARLDSLEVQVGAAINMHRRALHTAQDASTAVIAWMCYDAPSDDVLADLATVISQDTAEDGAARLAYAVGHLRAARGDDQPHLTVVAHSYGSTAAALAATEHGLDVDDLVLVGSPGVGNAEHAADLRVGADHVWVGSGSRDQTTSYGDEGVVGLGLIGLGLGNDPAEDAFGANRFRAESVERGAEPNFGDHNRYFDQHSESLANITRVVTGDYDGVVTAPPRYDPWNGRAVDPESERTPQQVP